MESDPTSSELKDDDESSLQGTANLDLNRCLTFSPLPTPRSDPFAPPPIDASKDNLHAGISSRSPFKDGDNKENCPDNKVELPKSSVEPKSLKRRKKGGACNLRKSLAWDKAFFTEEGVLDPLELSMISGTSGNSNGEIMSIINRGRTSLSGGKSGHSSKLNLSRESPANTQIGFQKGGKGQLRKNDSSAQNKVAQPSMALPEHEVHRSHSKGSTCSHPPASPSLRRLSIVNTTKATMKDINSFKTQGSKANRCIVDATSVSSTPLASRTKHNQIPQQAVNILGRPALRSSLNNSKIAKNNSEANKQCDSLSTKSSSCHSREIMENSSLKMQSSTEYEAPPVTKPSRALGTISDPWLGTGKILSDGASNVAVPCSYIAQTTSGDMGYSQPHREKPSGLRMPTPSLGFFGQPKASVSHTLSQRDTQPCILSKYSIPNLQRPGTFIPVNRPMPTNPPEGRPKVVNGITKAGNFRASNLSTDSYVPSPMHPVSQENFKTHSDLAVSQNAEVLVSDSFKSCGAITNQQQLPHILNGTERKSQGHVVRDMSINSKEAKLQIKDDNFLLKRKSFEKGTDVSRKNPRSEIEDHPLTHIGSKVQDRGVFEIDHMTDDLHAEDKSYLLSARTCISNSSILGPGYGDAINDRCAAVPLNNPTILTRDVRKLPPGVEAAMIQSHTSKKDSIVEKNNRLQLNNQLCRERNSAELCKYVSKDFADTNTKGQASTEIDVGTSHNLSQGQCTEQENEDAVEVKDTVSISLGEDAKMPLYGSMFGDKCDRNLSTSLVVGQCSRTVDNVTAQSREPVLLNKPGLSSNDLSSLEKDSAVENLKLFISTQFEHDTKHIEQATSSEICSHINITKDQIADALLNSSIQSTQAISKEGMEQVKLSYSEGVSFPEEPDAEVAVIREELESHRDENQLKQDNGIRKTTQNAAPFSDEWLAAIEAAGEEILSKKTGAVQHSPPDKCASEPSPWSPVKKNQAIGPFDCTKCTTSIPPSQ